MSVPFAERIVDDARGPEAFVEIAGQEREGATI
jgi:hypothetical protein